VLVGNPAAATSVKQQRDHDAREFGADQGRIGPNPILAFVTILSVLGIGEGALRSESQEHFAFYQRRLHWVSIRRRKKSVIQIRKFVLATCMFAIPVLATPHAVPVPEPESLAVVGIEVVALMIARWSKRK
jgi:hypothetical protein